MPEVVATIPSKPLGTCAAVTLDILPRSSCEIRCGRTEGRRNVHVATNFYTPKLLTFQPAVSDEGIRLGVGQRFGAGWYSTISNPDTLHRNGGRGLMHWLRAEC